MLIQRYTSPLLYHYTKRKTAIERILLGLTIRMSPLVEMNDLREAETWYFS